MMKKLQKIKSIIAFGIVSLALSCGKNTSAVDTERPIIDGSFSAGFPQQCGVLKRGETFVFKARFSDNAALGAFKVDIHENFDHHNHSTDAGDCEMGPKQTPQKPFTYIKSFDIPDDLLTYEAQVEIEIPADIDAGDYHFLIEVTDQTGWQAMRGLSVRIQ